MNNHEIFKIFGDVTSIAKDIHEIFKIFRDVTSIVKVESWILNWQYICAEFF